MKGSSKDGVGFTRLYTFPEPIDRSDPRLRSTAVPASGRTEGRVLGGGAMTYDDTKILVGCTLATLSRIIAGC